VDYLLNGVSNSLNWYAIGKVAFNAKKLDAAKHAFDKSLEYERDNPYTHYYRARLDIIEGRHDNAIRSLNTSIELFKREHGDIACEPDEIGIADAYAALGMAYDEVADLRRAVGMLKRALDLRPNDSFVHNYLGTVYAKLGPIDKAIASFQAAIAADSKNRRAHFNLGSALVSQGRTDEAIVMYERAAELEDGYIQPRLHLAKLYEQVGRNDSAIEAYERCMVALDLSEEIEPDAKQELASFIQEEIKRVRTQLSDGVH
jgi:tetratricopeptide (TPR) repeat protein